MSIMRSVGSPIRRYFNQHFEMVKQEVRRSALLDPAVAQMGHHVQETVEASRETQVFVARQLGELLGRIDELEGAHAAAAAVLDRMVTTIAEVVAAIAQLPQIAATLDGIRSEMPALLTPPIPQAVLDISPRDSVLLNKLNTHDGYLAQTGLWINDPLSCGFAEDGLNLQDVNERIGELPFVFSRVGRLRPRARVLDVGSCESTVALSLASLGYDVMAVDPRPYRFEHPGLRVVTGGVEDLPVEGDRPFDAVVLLSTIEHLGLGAYGLKKGNRQDLIAMRHIHDLLRPGGLLVLTTPFGIPKVDELERTYDVEGIQELIQGFDLDDEPTVLVRQSRTEWTYEEGGFADVTDNRQRVVMLSAHRLDQ